ncbi:MAG: EAL domain-containing protein [Proteobacteria bacterium]|nr:EAL domain-containing protein [Pseudomonadota bacterium]
MQKTKSVSFSNLDFSSLFFMIQPKFDLKKKNQTICGAEALMRHYHPHKGIIGPEAILKKAIESDQMPLLCFWSVQQILKQLKEWGEEKDGRYYAPFRLAVNICPSVINRSFVQEIFKLIEDSCVSPTSLEIELTETFKIKDFGVLRDSIDCLRKEGIKIALDDFGTGYSSMQYLTQLSLDTIKIDKVFVQQAVYSAPAKLILQTLIELGKELGYEVVCEGVENIEQLNLVKKLGADSVQGFLLSEPIHAEMMKHYFYDVTRHNNVSYLYLKGGSSNPLSFRE